MALKGSLVSPNQDTEKKLTMKRVAYVPFGHIDALSFGLWEFTINKFESWLRSQMRLGIKLLIIQTPKNRKEQCVVSYGGPNVKEVAASLGFVVLSENRLRRAGLLKKEVAVEENPWRFPNPFEQIHVLGNIGTFVPFAKK